MAEMKYKAYSVLTDCFVVSGVCCIYEIDTRTS